MKSTPLALGTFGPGQYALASGATIICTSPNFRDVPFSDYATGLSNYPRFGGQFLWKHPLFPWILKWYSLAEHCVTGMRQIRTPQLKLPFLLHDAPEGLGLADVITPVKRLLPQYMILERAYEIAIADRFGFDPKLFTADEVVEVDRRMLATEQMQVRSMSIARLSLDDRVWKPYPDLKLAGWSRRRAYKEYLNELTFLASCYLRNA